MTRKGGVENTCGTYLVLYSGEILILIDYWSIHDPKRYLQGYTYKHSNIHVSKRYLQGYTYKHSNIHVIEALVLSFYMCCLVIVL